MCNRIILDIFRHSQPFLFEFLTVSKNRDFVTTSLNLATPVVLIVLNFVIENKKYEHF